MSGVKNIPCAIRHTYRSMKLHLAGNFGANFIGRSRNSRGTHLRSSSVHRPGWGVIMKAQGDKSADPPMPRIPHSPQPAEHSANYEFVERIFRKATDEASYLLLIANFPLFVCPNPFAYQM